MLWFSAVVGSEWEMSVFTRRRLKFDRTVAWTSANVIRRQELWLQLQTASFVLRLLVFVGAYMYGATPLTAIGAFVTAVVCINTCYIVYIGWFLRSRGMPAEVENRDSVDS